MRYVLLSLPLYLLACGEEPKDTDITDTDVDVEEIDNDGDGFAADVDCDDDNADVNPDATETCDEIDNDCDGLIDADDDTLDLSTAPVFFTDSDGDGFGTGDAIAACDAPEGTVDNDLDCDDSMPEIHPGAQEVCDGMDNDCDSLIDDGDDSIDTSTMMTGYEDNDGDGEGDASTMVMACELPATMVFNADDCDDGNAAIATNAVERCDGLQNQCSATNLPSEEMDDDGDGYVECSIDEGGWQGDTSIVGGDDCDDTNSSFHAIADWYFDDDGDGFGDDSTLFVTCVPPPNGYVLQGNDCDDSNALTHPNATEICDGVYNDCNDASFTFTGAPADEMDNDGDGYVECSIDSSGWSGMSNVVGGDDCDDGNGLYYTVQDWYIDVDGDGFGNANLPLNACVPPSSIYTTDNTDCNDSDANTYVGAPELCDGLVNDCSSTAPLSSDEVDDDGDGFVECVVAFTGWNGIGSVVGGMDCDDDEAEVFPLATEVCDGLDNDCDGDTDDDDGVWDTSSGIVSYSDLDGDGEGDSSTLLETCSLPAGNVLNDTDCDDDNATLNNSDLDQDGLTSCGEDTTGDGRLDSIDCDDTDGAILATDNDGDGFIACVDDCDDNDANVNPLDNDGDGLSTCDGDCDDANSNIGIEDNDGDGFSACLNDCDDTDANTYPGAAFNEADPTLCLEDADGDGYGNYVGYIGVLCFDIEMTDSYGDGWNGNEIEVYEDGVLTGTYANENLDGTTGSETQNEEHCFDINTTLAEFVFNDGSYNSEVSFTITNSIDQNEVGTGQGTGTTDLIWDGITYTDGDTFFSFDPSSYQTWTGGTDCDDTDPTYTGDEDGDGSAVCVDDCDDTDASINPYTDNDEDGFSTCDDCDDGDANVNPSATEVWYDGIDQNCDAVNDFDQDEDGYEVDFYVDDNGVNIAHGGLDCNDESDQYLPLSSEANPVACYYDYDGDGYGDDSLSSTAQGFGATEGTDCYDFNDGIYPGAAYNEPDVDGDGVADCTRDNDGDGFGDPSPSSFYNALAGTDCDDSDEFTYIGAAFNEMDVDGDGIDDCTEDADGDGFAAQEPTSTEASMGTDCDDGDDTRAPGVDNDGDGLDTCNDCDDTNATITGGFLYIDSDNDGYGAENDIGILTCDLSTLDLDGDGINEYSLLGTDCNDNDSLRSPFDNDGDGFGGCENANGLADCDDTDPDTYPGAGFNEAGFDPNDYSTYVCQYDGDGDGYIGQNPIGCFEITMTDSYGDSWNGNTIEVYEDGILTETLENENLDGITNSSTGGETQTVTFCPLSNTYLLELVYNDGSYNSEVSFELYDEDGALILDGQGSGTYDLIVNGVTYTDGDTIYSVTGTTGSDPDDADPTVP